MNGSPKRGRKPKDPMEWWMNHIQHLTQKDNIVAVNLPVDESIIDRKGLWTLKKLIAYKYYIDIYTRIIPRRYNRYYYFDLFSGCGLVNIEDTNKNIRPFKVFGSALLAVLYSNLPFTKYVFVDADKRKLDILDSLLSYIKSNYNPQLDYECICADMNDINRYKNMLAESAHSLVVIDPYGLEPQWDTIKEILSYNCDVIITLMKSGIARVLGKALKHSPADKSTLEAFCGFPIDEIVKTIVDEEKKKKKTLDAFFSSSTNESVNKKTIIDEVKKEIAKAIKDRYIEKIREEGKKEAHEIVEISASNFGYDIIIAAKKTRGNNPWLKQPIEDLRERLADDDILISIIKQIQGTIQGTQMSLG